MKKSARRILSLVLTLVLICALAVSAFAATLIRDEYEDSYATATLDLREQEADVTLWFEEPQARSMDGTLTLTYTHVRKNSILSQTITVYEEITESGNYGANASVSTAFFMDEATANVRIELNYGSWQDTYTLTRPLYCDRGNNW